ncbi:hypothetical protein F8A10_05660 [Paracoccus kondratievae]|uniref:Antifreeze glycopeptide n=1 Tax=Paracoccus kondratievae TaxID=135740 RepID=A0AAD3NXA9_9RHOB|nr:MULTISPECIES: hypothetical protein [Paracoccus]QFQ86955.1 hypothetical protein F8A10_05660 [Paracoccus kondratievae]GLK64316.1 hypothetical protein GCM10017635_17870 [Paracoccus kondratievae]SMG46788.1 hypothetical protein SAMN02746000_02853 [Paracoccus sp. J56]
MTSTDGFVLACALAAGLTLALPAAAKPPLSASDWLSGSVQDPGSISSWRPGDPRPAEIRRRSRRDIAPTGAVEPVGVTRLGEGNPDGKGTVSPRTAGLPADMWGDSDSETLVRLIRGSHPRLPALRRLERRLLAAQLHPPRTEAGQEGALFLARVDKLLDMGATGAAKELLKTAGPGDPQRFRRLFDIALLSGDEAQACQTMDRTPGVAPSFPARIFCLALGGDWAAAALVFHGAEQMGQIDPQMAALLAQYLDDGYSDQSNELVPPPVVTPLDLRLHEAIGQPLPSSSLPLAFSLADLDQNGGWKARLDAAERLARAGAIPASQLRMIYLEQKPAASGGVWERASAVQALADALLLREPAAVAKALPRAFDTMIPAGLGPALADMVGADVGAMQLEGRAGQIALWLALQAGQPQVVQGLGPGNDPFDEWLLGFAEGEPEAAPPQGNMEPRAAELFPAFVGPSEKDLSENAAQLILAKKRGEALLNAISDVDAGLDGDLARAAQGLRVLRVLGQQEIARQAAVELILAPVMMPAPGSSVP